MRESDYISRQDALEMLDENIEACNKALGSFDIALKDEYAVKVERASLVAFREQLEYLPSTEPDCENCIWDVCNYNNAVSAELAIARCKDCKYWQDIDNGRQRHKMCAELSGYWFCGDAERKE